MKKVLIIVPHGDDEVLMCGGTIVKHIECGDNVVCVFSKLSMTERQSSQTNNVVDAKNVLGYSRHIHLGLTENDMLSNSSIEYMKKIEGVNIQEQPDIVYTTFWGDSHQDHRATFTAVSTAFRIWGFHPPKQILCGETLSSTDQSLVIPFMPNYYNVLQDRHIKIKTSAFLKYINEVRVFPHPRSIDGIELVAKKRGSECGHTYAEAFMSIRNIIT